MDDCSVQECRHVGGVPVVEDHTKVYDVVCLNGVQYWHREWHRGRSLTPKYGPHSALDAIWYTSPTVEQTVVSTVGV